MENFDLLSTVEYGGCSAKLDPSKLKDMLDSIPLLRDNNVMVGIQTHDDAGVYRLDDQTALIVTTDFFPPLCSDAVTFGRIAAANALSDVYAMGGKPLLTLNLNMFPSDRIPVSVLADILRGGQEKVNESGAFTMGGHTIEDYPPKYGLAVVGTVHPDRLVTNGGVKAGQKLILTKPLGTGAILAAHRAGCAGNTLLQEALSGMQQLNAAGAGIMQRCGVTGATDVTGFGLVGHAVQMADASGVTLAVESRAVPRYAGVMALLEEGCIPGAVFRNLRYVEERLMVGPLVVPEEKLLLCDAQTSGGLLMAVDADRADAAVNDLIAAGYADAAVIGEAIPRRAKALYIE